MIKVESKIVDDENCGVNVEVNGTIKDLYIESAMIIKSLVDKVSKAVDKDKEVILGDILKEILLQMGDK
ncbi:hypothetical protein [Clostridium thermobutyricum]|uniref:Uncharacterized protein n=1 Tax=Clostridium thermobutyricum DSM 4928 TaxID=1121339 RepID=A0A1V4SWE0_9CLOT|nr:hypothetical protein [Clostridium thermobutyricum]OPX48522.1 hypothetical protein CLTHE_12010 [Clostridium thermobutyricum DSM 4928]